MKLNLFNKQCAFRSNLEMLLLFVLLCLCESHCSASKGKAKDASLSLKTKWYGPSYQPKWWFPSLSAQFLRKDDFSYYGPDDNASFKAGAFEGSIIGLSIGVVLGSIRAISLEGVPHSEDETPCKALISHILGGLLSGALIGLVYVFFKECLFM